MECFNLQTENAIQQALREIINMGSNVYTKGQLNKTDGGEHLFTLPLLAMIVYYLPSLSLELQAS